MTKEQKTELGRQLKAIRTKRGQTLVHLATLLTNSKMTADHLSEIERGKGSHGLGAITTYAEALGFETKATYQFIKAKKTRQCTS